MFLIWAYMFTCWILSIAVVRHFARKRKAQLSSPWHEPYEFEIDDYIGAIITVLFAPIWMPIYFPVIIIGKAILYKV
jgi:hypothetical protein